MRLWSAEMSLVGGDEIQLFRNGTLAVSFCWNAAQQNNTDNGEAGKTNNGDNIIPMQFPTEDGSAAKLCGGIWGFGIFDNGDADKIAASKEFIRFICNDPDQAKESVKVSSFFPVHTNMTGVYDGTDIADTMTMFTEKFMPAMGDYYQVRLLSGRPGLDRGSYRMVEYASEHRERRRHPE